MSTPECRPRRRFGAPRGRFLVATGAVLLATLPAPALAAGSATGSNVPWYLSRASGMVAYLLLFLTVTLGLAIRTRAFDRIVARWRVTDMHGFLSVLVIGFVVVHVAVLLADRFIGYAVVELLIPFASSYEPFWTSLGIATAYFLLIVTVSFPARGLIGYRAWRALHYGTFVIYLGALAHGIFLGTDSRTFWAQGVYVSTAGIVLGLVGLRLMTWERRAADTLIPRQRPQIAVQPPALRAGPALPPDYEERRAAQRGRALAFGFGSAAIALLLLFAAGAGPFRWGRGQASLAAGATQAEQAAPASAATVHGFTDTFTGSMVQYDRPGSRSLSLRLAGKGDRDVSLEIQVLMTPAATDDGIGVANNRAVLRDEGLTPLCSGEVTALGSGGFTVACTGSGPYAGHELTLRGAFTLSRGTQVQGTLTASIDNG